MDAAPVRPFLALAALASAALTVAASYEGPRTFQASEILTPAQIEGPHHRVAAQVPTEGDLHVFSIETDYGPLEAEGRSLLLTRLHEVGALAQLDEVSRSVVFLKAAGNSLVRIGEGVVSAVRDPEATARGIGGGLKRFGTNLGRKAKRLGDKAADSVFGDDEEREEGEKESAGEKAAGAAEGIANSVLGINAAARRWAEKVRVDPYTTNPILRKALLDLGRVDAAGRIVTRIVLPVPMLVSTTATVGDLVWSQDPEALLKRNEERLRAIGVTNDVIKELYLSRGFTLTSYTRLATALGELNVGGAADYAAAAAESDTEVEALFFVESAEMLQRVHTHTPVVEILEDSRALVAKTKAGGAVMVLPLDHVRWTEGYEKAVVEVTRRAKAELRAATIELHTTGFLSATARRETAARGWTVAERVPPPVETLLESMVAGQ